MGILLICHTTCCALPHACQREERHSAQMLLAGGAVRHLIFERCSAGIGAEMCER